jgi:hypothetical protein
MQGQSLPVSSPSISNHSIPTAGIQSFLNRDAYMGFLDSEITSTLSRFPIYRFVLPAIMPDVHRLCWSLGRQ